MPLSERNVEGLYAIPLTLTNHEATEKYVSIAIELKRTKTLPTKKVISKFLDPVTQSTEFNSGAALSVMMLEKYGKLISQEEFRKIVDYVKEKSNWGDAEFQTWRLVLKRILTNSSITLGDFKKSEEEI